MQSSRLKNIIILILLLLNLFLLGSLGSRKLSERNARQRVQEQLVSLFASADLELSADVISFQVPPAGGTLTRDVDLDQQAAIFLLGGNPVRTDQGGGIYSFASGSNSAVFRSNGSFDAETRLDAPEEAEAICRKFCKEYHYQDFTFQENAGSALRYFNGYPVVNCSVAFTVKDHTLTVSGTHLPDSLTADHSEEPLSAVSALTAFLAFRRSSGAVGSAVTDMYPCYELQSTAAAAMSLVPVWCIQTDAASYYVNCYTGAVAHS